MRNKNYAIKNVELWSIDGVQSHCHLLIENGVVTALDVDDLVMAPNVEVINGTGKVLIPAGVDPQVHLRVPGQSEKETAASGLQAALKGGVGALLTMPNTKPVIDTISACEQAQAELFPATEETGVKVLLSAAITKQQKGQECVDFKSLTEWGIAAFTDDGVGVMSDELMEKVLAWSEVSGLPVLQHAETVGHGGVLAPGPIQQQLNMAPYPSSAETDMVARDLKLLEKYPKAHYHVLHISSKGTLDLIEKARSKGLHATCEVSPHHLFFSSHDIKEGVSSFKMNPPLRSPEDQQALQDALAAGTINFVATDHAPHEIEIKGSNFKTAAYGTTGLETSLRVLLSLYKNKKLSCEQLVRVFSYNPARFLGLDESYGSIGKGLAFHGVLVDISQISVVSEGDFGGKSKNSCFMGTSLPGKIETVFLQDRIHKIN